MHLFLTVLESRPLTLTYPGAASQEYGQTATGQEYGQTATGQEYGQTATGQEYGQTATGHEYGQTSWVRKMGNPRKSGNGQPAMDQENGQPAMGQKDGQPAMGQEIDNPEWGRKVGRALPGDEEDGPAGRDLEAPSPAQASTGSHCNTRRQCLFVLFSGLCVRFVGARLRQYTSHKSTAATANRNANIV